MKKIPDSDDIRAIRERDRSAPVAVGAEQAARDRRDLLVLLDEITRQAHEGVFVDHQCPAVSACAYIVAQTVAPQGVPRSKSQQKRIAGQTPSKGKKKS